MAGGCCGAGSGAVLTASCCWADAVEANRLRSKTKQRVIAVDFAVCIITLLFIALPCLVVKTAFSPAHDKDSANGKHQGKGKQRKRRDYGGQVGISGRICRAPLVCRFAVLLPNFVDTFPGIL